MANNIRIVTPDDMGNTIVLGSDNKYNVAVDQLNLPDGITGVSLSDTTLTISTTSTQHTADLSTLVPNQVVDLSLKSIERQGNKVVFTVGEKGKTTQDTTIDLDVSDLLPVQVGNTLQGDGTTGSPLGIKVSVSTDSNLLKVADDGAYVSTADIQALIPNRTIRLVNASGETKIGFIHNTES